MKRATIALAVIITCGPTYVAAQSLADVARAEEARRQAVEKTTAGKTAKVYTNNNLKADITSSAPAGSTPDGMLPPAAPATPGTVVEEPPAADTPQRDEKFWAGRLTEARAAVERNKTFAAALQSRINALTTDFVNRDDPAQRAVIETDRNKSLDELKRVQKDIETGNKAIADIQEEGRRAGVPAGWLR